MKIAKGLTVILLFIIFLFLAVQNYESLTTTVPFQGHLLVLEFNFPVPIYGMIIVFFILGLVTMAIFSVMDHYNLKRDINAIKRAVKEKDKELNSLRNLPITSNELPGYKEEVK